MWQRYYTRWRSATRERLDPRLLELMSPLGSLPAGDGHRQNALFRFCRAATSCASAAAAG